MKSTSILSSLIILSALAASAHAQGFKPPDVMVTIYKKPNNGPVNVRGEATAYSTIVHQVYHGQTYAVEAGSCENAQTGEEISLHYYRTRAAKIRKLRSPNVFCAIKWETSPNLFEVGWVRGTHLLPKF